MLFFYFVFASKEVICSEINTQLSDMDILIPEHIVRNSDDSYTILLNARLSHERQLDAYEHALKHIHNHDFLKINANIIEKDTHSAKVYTISNLRGDNIVMTFMRKFIDMLNMDNWQHKDLTESQCDHEEGVILDENTIINNLCTIIPLKDHFISTDYDRVDKEVSTSPIGRSENKSIKRTEPAQSIKNSSSLSGATLDTFIW